MIQHYMETLAAYTGLTQAQFLVAAAAVFLASVVRGFSGFALSALVIAALAVIIPPIELIPLCWFLELAAGLLMVRGSMSETDWDVVIGLVIGTAVGTPVGLALTTTLPVETSKMIALGIVLTLAALQLFRVKATYLATKPGLYLSGLAAGVVTGLASVGGLVVALYVLAKDSPARVMRASLVMFLFASSFMSFIYLVLYGMMDGKAVARAAIFTPLVVAGVLAGSVFFRPSMERYYKRFCLFLLIGLAGFGLVRMAAGQ